MKLKLLTFWDKDHIDINAMRYIKQDADKLKAFYSLVNDGVVLDCGIAEEVRTKRMIYQRHTDSFIDAVLHARSSFFGGVNDVIYVLGTDILLYGDLAFDMFDEIITFHDGVNTPASETEFNSCYWELSFESALNENYSVYVLDGMFEKDAFEWKDEYYANVGGQAKMEYYAKQRTLYNGALFEPKTEIYAVPYFVITFNHEGRYREYETTDLYAFYTQLKDMQINSNVRNIKIEYKAR